MDATNDISQEYPIVLYDGDCKLCNTAIQFIIRHEKSQILRFSSLSDVQKKFDNVYFPNSDLPDAIHFLHKGEVLIESDAALAITRYLKWPFSWIQYTRYIPKAIRDYIYRAIAKRRLSMQSLFSNTCVIEEDYADRMV